MNALLAEANELIGKMTRSEKARVLKWVATDLGDEIEQQIALNEMVALSD